MKLLFTFDPETGEPIEFMWNEGRRPPPLVKSKIKKKGGIMKKEELRDSPFLVYAEAKRHFNERRSEIEIKVLKEWEKIILIAEEGYFLYPGKIFFRNDEKGTKLFGSLVDSFGKVKVKFSEKEIIRFDSYEEFLDEIVSSQA